MFSQRNGNNMPTGRRRIPVVFLSLAALVAAGVSQPVHAEEGPSVSVGAGLQTSFLHHQPYGAGKSRQKSPGAESTNTFRLNSLRLYVNGSATDNIKFMLNTDVSYGGSLGAPGTQNTDFQILDAVAQIEVSERLNLWFGRFLPPSDRANLYGPFYSSHWGVFSDGVQDGYPFVFQGRDNGIAYWGQFDNVKLSLGVFDGGTATGDSSVLTAARMQVDFWDPEPGYYMNGTYYGTKNIAAIGLAMQIQSGGDVIRLGRGGRGAAMFTEPDVKNAFSADLLIERMVPGGGAATIEAEYAYYGGLGGYPTAPGGAFETLKGGYFLGAYLFSDMAGPGRFQFLAKIAKAQYSHDRAMLYADFGQRTVEVNLNYIMNQHNARLMIFAKDTDYTKGAPRPDDFQVGVALQIQM